MFRDKIQNIEPFVREMSWRKTASHIKAKGTVVLVTERTVIYKEHHETIDFVKHQDTLYTFCDSKLISLCVLDIQYSNCTFAWVESENSHTDRDLHVYCKVEPDTV